MNYRDKISIFATLFLQAWFSPDTKQRFFVSDRFFSPDENVFHNFTSLIIIHYRSFLSDELYRSYQKSLFSAMEIHMAGSEEGPGRFY